MKNLSSLLLCACMLVTVAYGQGDVRTRGAGAAGAAPSQTTRKVTGRVVDAAGQPLAGASVSVVDAAGAVVGGVYSDANGAFTVSVPEGTGYRLRVSYVSFGTSTTAIQASGDQTLRIEMQEEGTSIDEVRVIGYGTQYKSKSTGAQGSVSGTEINNIPVTSFDQALQGRLAGAQITTSSGKVGQSTFIRVRGPKSITAGNQPLIVIDNVIINQENSNLTTLNTEPLNPLNEINPNDIEDVQLLKDAQATAIYGSRGANGVLLITTKGGKFSQKATTTVDYQYGLASPTRYRPFLNVSEYITLANEARANAGFTNLAVAPLGAVVSPAPSRRYIAGTDVDWQRQVLLENRPLQSLSVATQGGTDKTSFYVSLGLFDQQGILVGNRLNRVSGRINLTHKLTDKATIGARITIARTLTERQADDNAFSNQLQAVAFAPIDEQFNPDGTIRAASRVTGYPNPLLALDNSFAITQTYRTQGTIFYETKFIKDLMWHIDLGLDYTDLREQGWRGYRMTGFTGVPDGQATASGDRIINYQTNTYVQWTPTWLGEDHDLDVTAGFAFQYGDREFEFVEGQGLPVGDRFRYLNSAARFTSASSGVTGYRFDSYFGRANYTWRDKVLVGASVRVDGSSRFGADSRYGTFWSASAGYILSQEDFIKNIEFISFLKPRVSYGTAGNAEIANFASRSLISPIAYKADPGVAFAQLGDRNLKWETTSSFNIGLDFGFFNNRLSGSIEYFRANTKDLLLGVQLPTQSGFATALRNVGEMKNVGWEASIGGKILTGAVKWEATFNITQVDNTVINAGKNADGTDARVIGGNADVQSVAQAGDAIGSFFGADFFGVDPANGNALYWGPNGTLTNNYSAADRRVIGNPNPRYFGGVNNTVTWKGIDLTIFWQYAIGHDVFNSAGQFMAAGFGGGRDNQLASEMGRWTTPGQNTMIPRPYFFGIGTAFGENGSVNSSRHIQDASYWRLKTATLGYTLPTAWVSKLKLTKVRIYVTGQNLLTVTQFQGWDPEVNSTWRATGNQNINLVQGDDFYTVPQPRTWLFGATIQF